MTHMNHAAHTTMVVAALMLLASTAEAQGTKPLKKCPPDAVISGTVCMDKFEASVWRVPNPTTVNKGLVKKIQQGKATAQALTDGGAVPLGTALDDYAPCADNGQNCADVYAVSLPAATAGSNLTWFQAQQACKNARKRLPSNAEWQAAVAGTPDPGPDNGTTDCNTTGPGKTGTGYRSSCVSSDGAFDMVGNVDEWVADWVPKSTDCPGWDLSGDKMCLAGASTTALGPGALLRGGGFVNAVLAGPLCVDALFPPSFVQNNFGFRCAR